MTQHFYHGNSDSKKDNVFQTERKNRQMVFFWNRYFSKAFYKEDEKHFYTYTLVQTRTFTVIN